jgi:hypothetical protein
LRSSPSRIFRQLRRLPRRHRPTQRWIDLVPHRRRQRVAPDPQPRRPSHRITELIAPKRATVSVRSR